MVHHRSDRTARRPAGPDGAHAQEQAERPTSIAEGDRAVVDRRGDVVAQKHKLGVHSRVEVAVTAIWLGLVEPMTAERG